MSVDYRLLHATEIDAAADLWGGLHGDPRQHEAWRREFRSLPQLLTHTRVAVAADGALLSIIHDWPLTVYGVDGQPQRVGRLSHVFTRPDARRQGYASRLLEMTLAAMRDDGRLWALLRTSEEARALYGRYGWRPLPVRQIACTAVAARPAECAAGAAYTVRSYDPAHERGGWEVLAAIHRAYNTGRPLTAVRDAADWRYIAARAGWWLTSDQAQIFVAAPAHQEAGVRAYAIATFSAARGFLVAEVGAWPGDEEALPALLVAIMRRAEGDSPAGRLYLPHDPMLEHALTTLGARVEDVWDDDYMVRAIAPGFDTRLLAPLPMAPGNVAWMLY